MDNKSINCYWCGGVLLGNANICQTCDRSQIRIWEYLKRFASVTAFVGAIFSIIVFVMPTLSSWWISSFHKVNISVVQLSTQTDTGLIVNQAAMPISITHLQFIPAKSDINQKLLPVMISVVNLDISARKSASPDLRDLTQKRIQRSETAARFEGVYHLYEADDPKIKAKFLSALEHAPEKYRIVVVDSNHTLLENPVSDEKVLAAFEYDCHIHFTRQDNGVSDSTNFPCKGLMQSTQFEKDLVTWLSTD